MKKRNLIIAILLTTLINITGCSNERPKVLTCTKDNSIDGITMTETLTLKFKDNNIYNYKANIEAIAKSDEFKQNWSSFIFNMDNFVQETFPTESKQGVKIETSNNKKNFTYQISAEIDLKNADKSVLTEFNIQNISKKSYDDIKKEIKKEGYKCN